MEEKKAKMREILAAQDGKTLPKNWKEVMENSPWKADWVPEQKRSPPGIVVPEISKIAESEPKMNFKSNTFWWEAW
jgi:hypothetical protein